MNKIIKRAAAIVTGLAVFVTAFVFDIPEKPAANAAVTPSVSITTGSLKTYTTSGDSSSTAYSKLTSTSGWTKSVTSGTNKYTVTLNEGSKNGNYTMGYVPITVSVTVPANTSYRTNLSFSISGSPNKSGGSGLNFVELFDFGTTDKSSSLTFSTTENNKSSTSYTAARDVRKTNDFTASYSVTAVFENTTSSDKKVSRYFGFFASGMKATTYKHQVKTTCTINYGKLVDDAAVAPIINFSNSDARYITYDRTSTQSVINSFSKEQFYPDVPSSSLTADDFKKMQPLGNVGPGDLDSRRILWDEKFKLSSDTNKLVFAVSKSFCSSQGKLAYVPFTVPIKVPAYTERTYYLTFEISFVKNSTSGAGFFGELIEGGVPSSFNTADSGTMTGNTKLRVFNSDGNKKTDKFSGTVTLPLTLKNDTGSAKTMYGNYVYFVGHCHVGAYEPAPRFELTLTDIGYASYEDDHYAEINASNCTYTHNQTITPGSDYNATITANTGYSLPSSVTVKCGGTTMATSKYTWNSSTGKLTIASKNITGGITVTANGVPNKYNITYSGLDGASLSTKPTTHTYGTATTVGDPTKTGYTFAGWKVNGGSTATKSLSLGATSYTANITLEATWTVNKYNAALSGSNVSTSSGFGTNAVTYNTAWTGKFTANTGYDLPSSITVTVGGASLASTKYTYSTSGSTGTVLIAAADVTGAVSVTAGGTAKTYSITYSGLTGASLTTKPTTHTYGTATTVGNPTKTGYTFAGWKVNGGSTATKSLSLGATAYTANISLEATWTANTYSATFSGTNTASSSGFGTGKVTYNTAWTGKFTANTGYDLPSSITVTVGGTTLASSKYTYSTSGSTGTVTISAANVTGAVTVTAVGTAKKYSATLSGSNVSTYSGFGTSAVTYNTAWTGKFTANTGYSLPSSVTVTVNGTTIASTKYTYTKSGSTGTVSISTGSNVTGAVVVTATPTANSYTITYSGLDGAALSSANKPTKHTYGTATTVGNPTKTGYTFAGWKVNGGTTATKSLTLGATAYTANITLEATWTINTYSATLSGTNVTASTGFGTGKVTYKTAWTGYITAASGYVLPDAVTVKVGGTTLTSSGYTYTKSSGKITITAANVTGAVTVTATGHKHSYTSTVTTAETCTTNGMRTYTCSGCGSSYTETISKTGHSYAEAWTTSPAQHWHVCTTCGTADSKLSHIWNDGEVTTEPTETSKGEKTFTCKTCSATKTEPIAMLEHTHHIDPDNWNGHDDSEHWHECEGGCGEKVDHEAHILTQTEYKAPTCTEDGYTKYFCEICQNTITKVIEARGHHFGHNWEHDGANHYHVCAICHAEKSDTEAHNWDSGTVDSLPDCTHTGVRVYECTVCQATKSEDIAVDADAHDWGDWVIITDPTMQNKGIIQSVCKINSEHIKTDEIPSLSDEGFWKSVDVTEPNCTENGAEIFECEYGYVTVAIPANGHSPVTDERVEPTCDSTGLTEGSHCGICGETFTVQNDIAPLGHNWNTGEITTEPTCTDEGVTTFSCLRCNETKTESITAKGHTEVIDSAVNADCTQTGLTEGKHCFECGAVIVEQEITPALGHIWSGGEITKQPTCTIDGVKTFSCTRCGETKTEDITAGGHMAVIDNAVSATCTEKGKTEGRHCSVCGKIIDVQENTPALGHSWDDGVVTTAPTETETGVRTYTCTVCGEEKEELIAPLNHTHNWNPEWYKDDDTYHWHDCLNGCDEKKDEAAHVWNDGKITKQPTENDDGEKTFECTVCGKTQMEAIPAAGGSVTPEDPDDGSISKEVKPGENVPETKLETPIDELAEAVLTPNEQETVKDGHNIKIILTVEDATNKVPPADKTAVEKAIGGLKDYKPGQYLDVNLFKVIDGVRNPITETKAAITITFEVPEKFRGSARTYSVIRVHDGETTVLYDEDNDPDTVTIETDKFSTYALAYQEKTTSSTPSESDSGSIPNTSGDNTSSDTAPSNTTSSDNTSSDTTPSDSTPSDSTPSDNTSSNTTPSDSTSSDTTPSDNTPSDSTPSDGTSDDDTSSGSNPTSDEITHIPSESSPSLGNDNFPTGIAISFIPPAAVFAVLPLTIKRKKK